MTRCTDERKTQMALYPSAHRDVQKLGRPSATSKASTGSAAVNLAPVAGPRTFNGERGVAWSPGFDGSWR